MCRRNLRRQWCALVGADKALHQRVFQSMKSNHCQHPAGLQQAGCGGKTAFNLADLIINGNADRLKRLRRRMKTGLVQFARHGIGDHRCQIQRGAQLAARRDDRTRDATRHRMRFAAPIADDPRQRRLIGSGEPVGRSDAAFIVHAHIKRPFLAKRKTARCLIELRRRHTQIEQNAVQTGRAYRRKRRIHAGKRTAREKKA